MGSVGHNMQENNTIKMREGLVINKLEILKTVFYCGVKTPQFIHGNILQFHNKLMNQSLRTKSLRQMISQALQVLSVCSLLYAQWCAECWCEKIASALKFPTYPI